MPFRGITATADHWDHDSPGDEPGPAADGLLVHGQVLHTVLLRAGLDLVVKDGKVITVPDG
jgi:hypothetical protein